VQRASKYLLISGVVLAPVGAILAWFGFLTIDVPELETWRFFIGTLLFIIAIVLIVAGAVIWAIRRVRS
jgi:membrane protein DedA with SNARE-associated domain